MSIPPKAVYKFTPGLVAAACTRATEATGVTVEVGLATHFEELLHLRAKSLLNSQKTDRLDDAHTLELIQKVQGHASRCLKKFTQAAPCRLFTTGTLQEPCGGFSKQMADILNEHNFWFSRFDILSGEEVHQVLKTYSNWPIYSQLYTICLHAPKLEERSKVLTNKASVMKCSEKQQKAKCPFS
ncbi:unnamed protein product [Nyctereutes procyonoides]|uniref:(raccoon dog) hypothetical protein n=1 Tax=Nyctereutes procyonoides TaxID=34880 RepID=A0A811ZXH2_NYCPR|nr:unnamed protein product [Nyctereutes procyonoides]